MLKSEIEQLEKWHFDLTEKACNYLLGLVLEGKKRATSSSLLGYQIEGIPVPKEGDMSVITDWEGTPACLVRTKKIRVLPFKNITFDIAKLEGEDETLDTWQANHVAFFTEEGKEVGYTFTEDMPVVFEEFEVVEIFESEKYLDIL